MLRRPYILNTVATAPVSSRDTEITLANATGLTLDAGDWAYLKLEEYSKIEIVKVLLLVGNTIYVVRAQDNTKAENFAEPTITYVLTAQEILDSLYTSYTVILEGTGAATATGSNVNVLPPIVTYEQAHYSFGADGQISIGREEDAYGCCPEDNGTGPNKIGTYGYGVSYTYRVFTSHPFAQIVQEKNTITVSLVGGESKLIGLGSLSESSSFGVSLTGGLVNEPGTGRFDDSSTTTVTLLGGLLNETHEGNVVEQSNLSVVLADGTLAAVATGNIVEKSSVSPLLVGGQLS